VLKRLHVSYKKRLATVLTCVLHGYMCVMTGDCGWQ